MLRAAAAVAIVAAGLAGHFVAPRTVTHATRVVDARPKIRVGADVATVRASFAGKPYRAFAQAGFSCEDRMQDQSHRSQSVGLWIIRVCVAGLAS